MSTPEFSLWIFFSSIVAGLLGSLTGLGGGVVIVPVLTVLFHVDIHYAIGASLVSVIATSSGAAAAYVREGYSNIRVGMFLEIATTLGALSGATLATHVPARGLAIVFGVVLMYSAYLSGHRGPETPRVAPDRFATALRLDSSYPAAQAGERAKQTGDDRAEEYPEGKFRSAHALTEYNLEVPPPPVFTVICN